jgi:transposase, IS6 family
MPPREVKVALSQIGELSRGGQQVPGQRDRMRPGTDVPTAHISPLLDHCAPQALLRWSGASSRDTVRVIAMPSASSSAPAGYRFPREVIAVAVRGYLRYGLSYRDVEELLADRGVEVDHVTIHRWVRTFTPQFIDAARPARHAAGDRWFVDETYLKVAGRWTYLYRAVDQHGQLIDVLVSTRRDAAAARRFFAGALRVGPLPVEVVTDQAPVYPRVLDELVPAARHVTEQYADNAIEADHGRLKIRATAHARTQTHRVRLAFAELALCL